MQKKYRSFLEIEAQSQMAEQIPDFLFSGKRRGNLVFSRKIETRNEFISFEPSPKEEAFSVMLGWSNEEDYFSEEIISIEAFDTNDRALKLAKNRLSLFRVIGQNDELLGIKGSLKEGGMSDTYAKTSIANNISWAVGKLLEKGLSYFERIHPTLHEKN